MAYRNEQRRQDAEERFSASDARMKSIVDTVIDGIITIDVTDLIDTFNPAAERIFGYPAQEIQGRNLSDLISEPGKTIGVGREMDGRRKDGTTFPIELSSSESRIGERRMFTVLVRDITERKRIEQLKNEFISTVSHELRTPLTSIRGALGLLLGGTAGTISEPVRALIDLANNNTGRLLELINDILDIEKIESGAMQYDLQPTALLPLIARSLEDNRAYGDQHGVSFVLDIAMDADRSPTGRDHMADTPHVYADRNRLLQVMANLLSNAAKFSPRDIEVVVSVSRRAGNIRVAVSNPGPGIPQAFRSRIFQKFAQADSSDTRQIGGTGLGLSISKAIVEKHGGAIGYLSSPDKITTFFFDLPELQDERMAQQRDRAV
jgi:signal transduction histidine kinase